MVSVIVPVYNTAQYLPDMVRSVLAQTHRDLEIILIDDGSTDTSGLILDSFAAGDPRVRVIHKENGGVSSARNVGLDAAKGDYITFADSDDTLEPDLYETLLRLIETYHVQIAHCSYNRIKDGKVIPVGNTGEIFVQSRTEALRELTCGSLFMGGCCNKLYARALFDDVRFDTSLKLSEDELVNVQVFSKVDAIVYQDVCKYNYLDSTTSACRNTHSLRRAQDHVEVAQRILDMNIIPELELPLCRKLQGACLQYCKSLICEKSRNRELLGELYQRIEWLRGKGAELSAKERMMYGLMRRCPPVFRLFYGLYDKVRVIE